MVNGFIFVETIEDSELLNLLEKEKYIVKDEELKDQEGSFYVYRYEYDNSIFDRYFE